MRWAIAAWAAFASGAMAQEPVRPEKPAALFNGKNLDGLQTWLKDTKKADPRGVFRAVDGVIHVSGDGFGTVGTTTAYRDFRVAVEFKWGSRTDGGKYVRNSGILLHATGEDGNAGGTWTASVECQLAQGCVGDLIPIRGKSTQGDPIATQFSAETILGPDKRPRWKAGGEKRAFTGKQLWWSLHDPTFKELLDTRGKDDVESPKGEWTKVECECRGDTIAVRVNGRLVNRCFDVQPRSGRILLQSEGFEIFFRALTIAPLEP